MRIFKSHMLGLAPVVFALISVSSAFADNSSTAPNRSTPEQNIQYSGNTSSSLASLSSLPSQADPRDTNRSDDVTKGKDLQSELNPAEQIDKNAAHPDEPRSIATHVMMNLRGYLLTMMSQWEEGPNETVPPFMATEQEINDALQKVLNRKNVSR